MTGQNRNEKLLFAAKSFHMFGIVTQIADTAIDYADRILHFVKKRRLFPQTMEPVLRRTAGGRTLDFLVFDL